MARLAAPRGRLSASTALLDSAALLLMVAVVAGHLLRLGNSALFPSSPAPGAVPAPASLPPPADSAPPPPNTAADPADGRLADAQQQALQQALQRLMTEQHAYRREDLSIASLAALLKVPEYRLRRLINQRLGHRNFNAFVNGYRLQEASAALADPQRRSLPVLSIALDAGFQSIGPFNRAFKAATGRTPSEYRREKLADS